MILAVDIGNTHTVLGCIDPEGKISHEFRIETNPQKTCFEYASDISQILRLLKLKESAFDGVIISSVVPALTSVLQDALKIVTRRQALIVGPGIKTGLRIQIDDPGTIAADLVTAAVAAKEEYPLPAVIIDMGTATTITVVNKEGSYIGGVIQPGVSISMNALAEKTSLLPSIDVALSKKVIATATGDSMRSGIIYGTAGSVDGILDRFLQELGTEDVSLISTGGMAHLIIPYCRHKIIIEENLLLKGLWHIWKKNQ